MSYNNPRIKDLTMTRMDAIVLMVEGNPGAAVALAEMCKNAETIDPHSALGAMGPVFALDTLDCYGKYIHAFYKYLCGSNVRTALGLLRAVQLGILSGTVLRAAIEVAVNTKPDFDIPAILAQVKERLPAFQIVAATA